MAEFTVRAPIIELEFWKQLPFGEARNKARRAAYSKRWMTLNKSHINEYHKSRTPDLKSKVFALFGNYCKECGFDDSRALQIDHINGQGGKEVINKFGSNTYYRKLLALHESNPNEFFSKYQLLCANHNWIKRFEERELYK